MNEPQFELPQVTIQFTPLFDGSFVTTAVRAVMLLICTEEGGGGLKETMGAGVMVILAEANFVGSAVEVAVTVTMLPEGTAAGAV